MAIITGTIRLKIYNLACLRTGQCFIALRPINIGVEVTYIIMDEEETLERVPNVACQC